MLKTRKSWFLLVHWIEIKNKKKQQQNKTTKKAVKRMKKSRSSPQEVFYKTGAPKIFLKFTEKHMRRSLFLTELQVEGHFCEMFQNTYFVK